METRVVSDIREQMHAGLRALAERNHDVKSLDQTGFHRLDTAFGCALANGEHLNLAEVVVAARLLRRYQRALAVPFPDEATIINWAIEQENEVIDPDEMVIAAELADRIDFDFVVPTESGSQEDQAEADKKSVPDKRIYVQRERFIIEFPYDRPTVGAIQPLKEVISDWAFNRYHRQEWSFPLEDAWTVYEVTRSFQGFVYSADAAQAIKRAYRKECLEDQARELEQHWQELAQLSALEAAQPYLDGAPTLNGQRLFRHQREAVQRMIEAGRFILAHHMGLGKTKSSLIAALAYDLPIWVIAPAGTLINWQREAAAVGAQITLFSWAKLPEPPLDLDYVLIADECFPYHTQVMTDCGLLPIGAIVEQALPVSVLSYDIKNNKTEWKPIIRYVKRSLQGHLVKVTHEHGSFLCTPNHKIWTQEHGYVAAGSLTSGTHLLALQEALSCSQERQEDAQVLQLQLCRQIQCPHAGTPGGSQSADEQTSDVHAMRVVPEGIHLSLEWQSRQQQASLLQPVLRQLSEGQLAREPRSIPLSHQICTSKTPWQQTARCLTTYETQQSYERPRHSRENATEVSRSYFPSTWRERRTYYSTTHARTSIDITYRIPNTYSTSQGSVPLSSHLLQSRHSRPGASSGNRSRWQNASAETLEVSGQAQNRSLECSRVVRVEVYEPEGADGAGPSGSGNPAVYNLEILDNHNYIADGVLVSNCHYAQSGEETIRGKGFLRLADAARAVFMLTGTPLRNSLPINLWPLLVAARHPLAADRSAYEKQYCGAYFKSLGRKKTVYQTDGATNLDELHERTKDVILYKKKSECVDLPDKLRMRRQAEVSATGEVAYRKTIERLREAHFLRMADKYEALRAGREELLGEGIEESELGEFEQEYASALVELGIYRHAASLAKVESAVEIAQEALAQGQSVLLFTAFRDTAERLATKMEADCLTGEVTGKRRQAMIDRFQAEESKVLVATIGAGGIGINLTAAQTVVLVDRAWTPGDTEQAEDRAHRLGLRHNVLSLWLQYGPVDDKIDQLLALKQERIEIILRGRGKNLRGTLGIRALAREIMESVHTGKSLAEILGLDPSEFEEKAVDLVRDDVPGATTPQDGGKKDGRLKGRVRRVRRNITLDTEVVEFLETMKVSSQMTSKESGYSGFLERLVRQSAEYQAYQKHKHNLQKQERAEGEPLENPLSSSVQ